MNQPQKNDGTSRKVVGPSGLNFVKKKKEKILNYLTFSVNRSTLEKRPQTQVLKRQNNDRNAGMCCSACRVLKWGKRSNLICAFLVRLFSRTRPINVRKSNNEICALFIRTQHEFPVDQKKN